MKIDQSRGVDSSQVTAASSNKTSTTNASRPATATQSAGSVKISEASRSLSTASTKSEAPFDAKRVDAIKSAISSGQFKVNPEAVADKIVSSASSLLVGS
jgi:negative regulator of flagellin synthesis FlgM